MGTISRFPTIAVVPMPVGGTKYFYTFPATTNRITISCVGGRDSSNPTFVSFRIALKPEDLEDGGLFLSIPRGMSYYDTDFKFPMPTGRESFTLHFTSANDSVAAEIMFWRQP